MEKFKVGFRKKMSDQEGSFLLLFALVLTTLILFIGLALDFTSMYMKKNELENYNHTIRHDRFTYSNSIRFSENPAQEYAKTVERTLRSNGFAGDIVIYFEEDPYEENRRHYKVKTVLSSPSKIHFLTIFGFDNEKIIEASVSGSETYGYDFETDWGGTRYSNAVDKDSVIWHPAGKPSDYNGKYTYLYGQGLDFRRGVQPDEW